jgi:hypothetical protein
MRSIRGIGLGILFAFAAVIGTAQAAHAESFNGFVCEVSYSPFTVYGQHGGVIVSYRTAPACGGAAAGSAQLQSTGATEPGSPVYRFADKAFHQIWDILIKGATAEASVQIFGDCAGGTCQIRTFRLRPL